MAKRYYEMNIAEEEMEIIDKYEEYSVTSEVWYSRKRGWILSDDHYESTFDTLEELIECIEYDLEAWGIA